MRNLYLQTDGGILSPKTRHTEIEEVARWSTVYLFTQSKKKCVGNSEINIHFGTSFITLF